MKSASPYPPLGMDHRAAAAYLGISAETLRQRVRAGEAPAPRMIGRRRIFDRRELDQWFASLPTAEEQARAEECREADEVFGCG